MSCQPEHFAIGDLVRFTPTNKYTDEYLVPVGSVGRVREHVVQYAPAVRGYFIDWLHLSNYQNLGFGWYPSEDVSACTDLCGACEQTFAPLEVDYLCPECRHAA